MASRMSSVTKEKAPQCSRGPNSCLNLPSKGTATQHSVGGPRCAEERELVRPFKEQNLWSRSFIGFLTGTEGIYHKAIKNQGGEVKKFF